MSLAARFEKMLAEGEDTALLRFGLGNAYLQADPERAAIHLQRAVELQENYSAAWKLLGKALTNKPDINAAIDCYERGIEIAEQQGDKQAAREMQVFLKRLRKQTER